jgi:hypothetical protein
MEAEEMSRLRKDERELRNSVTGVRLTMEERRQIASEADACGLSVSSFMRKKCLGGRTTPKTDLRVLAELRRLGGLLKHLHNETKGAYSALTSDCLREMAAYVRRLNAEFERRYEHKEDSTG